MVTEENVFTHPRSKLLWVEGIGHLWHSRAVNKTALMYHPARQDGELLPCSERAPVRGLVLRTLS